MKYDPNNIFARILRGEIPCKKIYEDEHALAFHDIAPQAPVHVLVIPKGAYMDVVDFGANASGIEVTGFYRAVAKISKDIGIADNGFRLIANTGLNGGQEVPHYHVHLLGGAKLGAMVTKKD